MRKCNTEQKRADIINIAMNCMKNSPFKEVSIRDICNAGNLSIGTFYNYFSNKEDLLNALLLKFDDFLTEYTVPRLTSQNEAENLYIYTDSFAVDSLNNTSRFGTVMSSTNIPLPHDSDSIQAERERPLYKIPENIIRSGQEKGQFSTTFSASNLAEKLVMMLRGASVEWQRRNHIFDLQEYTRDVTSMFLLMITNDVQNS